MTSRILRVALLLALALPTRGADKAADAESAAYRQMLAQQRKNFERMIETRPELRPGQTMRMDEIVRLSLADGKLVMTTPLATGPEAGKFNRGQMRVKIDGLPGYPLVMCQNAGRAAGQWFFSFSYTTFSDEGQTSYNLTSQPQLVQIARSFGSARRNANVNFTQQFVHRPEIGMEAGVTLSAYDGDTMGGRPPTSVNVRAKDFAELRRKYPREVDKHLRPMLKELRLEGLFTVEHAVAWQVFSAEWKRDDALERQVRELVGQLDADTYAARERAMAALRSLGPDAGLVLYHMGREGLSLEQAGRVDAIVAAHTLAPREQVAKMGADPDFLLDCLYSGEQAIREVATARLAKLVGHPLTLDPAAPKDVRMAQIETLRRELAPKGQPTTGPTTSRSKPIAVP